MKRGDIVQSPHSEFNSGGTNIIIGAKAHSAPPANEGPAVKSKGQLISQFGFGVFNSPKHRTKTIRLEVL